MRRQLLYVLVLFYLVTLADLEPGGGDIYVCSKADQKLFSNTTFDPVEEISLTLYRNRDIIAIWESGETIYEGKIYRDNYYDIYLRRFSKSDEGVYMLRYLKKRGVAIERKFVVAEPPLPSCRPEISSRPNDKYPEIRFLTATLTKMGCANPLLKVVWLNRPSEQNINIINSSAIEISINAIDEPGSYIACMTGPAMECVKGQSHMDFCSEYRVPAVYRGEERRLDTGNQTELIIRVLIILTFIIVAGHASVYLTTIVFKILNVIRI